MPSSFFEGLVAGYGIAIPVGAVAILIVNTALARGFSAGFMAGAGAATADLLYAALAAIAGVALSTALAPLATATRLIGGAALVALGMWGMGRSLRPPPVQDVRLDSAPLLRTDLNFVASPDQPDDDRLLHGVHPGTRHGHKQHAGRQRRSCSVPGWRRLVATRLPAGRVGARVTALRPWPSRRQPARVRSRLRPDPGARAAAPTPTAAAIGTQAVVRLAPGACHSWSRRRSSAARLRCERPFDELC
jgi:hypothetical protein